MDQSRTRSSSRSTRTYLMGRAHKLVGVEDAVDASHAEAQNSGFPGGGGGPQDAYRHLLVTAEIARTKGEEAARAYAHLNEVQSEARFAQSKADRSMDDHNNAIGVEIGKKAKTWDDVVRLAREKIVEAAKHNGDGKDRRVYWHNKPAESNWNPDIHDQPIAPNKKGGADEKHVSPLDKSRNPIEGEIGGMPGKESGNPAAPAKPAGASEQPSEAAAPAMTPAAKKIERFALDGEETLEELLRKPPERLTSGEIDRLVAEKTMMRPHDPLRPPAEEAVTAAFRHAFPGGSSSHRPLFDRAVPPFAPAGR